VAAYIAIHAKMVRTLLQVHTIAQPVLQANEALEWERGVARLVMRRLARLVPPAIMHLNEVQNAISAREVHMLELEHQSAHSVLVGKMA
jgi:hypothetical protein